MQHVEQTLDPTVELNKLLKEGKLEEAFHKALSGDLQLVSWLCLQVLCSTHLLTLKFISPTIQIYNDLAVVNKAR